MVNFVTVRSTNRCMGDEKISGKGIKRSFRYDVVSSIAAICPASFGTHLFLFFSYFSSHPTKANTALGFIHALNNHGSYVYLSDTEMTGLALLRMAFIASAIGTFAILPKDPALAPSGTPRWVAHFYVAKTDLVNPTRRLKTIFLCSIVFYLAVICLAGPLIVHFFVSQGMVLE
jgi:hypothetical protein